MEEVLVVLAVSVVEIPPPVMEPEVEDALVVEAVLLPASEAVVEGDAVGPDDVSGLVVADAVL